MTLVCIEKETHSEKAHPLPKVVQLATGLDPSLPWTCTISHWT